MLRASVLASATLIAAVTLAAAPAPAPAPDDKAAIQGVWRFQEEIDRRADGTVVHTGPAGGYDGLLLFTGGYMSSTLIVKGRTWKRATVSPAELRDTFEGSSAHAGHYELDPKTHTINIESIVSLDPADEGAWGPVHYALEPDVLTISGPWTYEGETLTFTIRLARAR
jgi:hypothetical protein